MCVWGGGGGGGGGCALICEGKGICNRALELSITTHLSTIFGSSIRVIWEGEREEEEDLDCHL